MIAGLALVTLAFCLMGPLPWFPDMRNLYCFGAGLVLLAVGLAFSIVPITPEIMHSGRMMRQNASGDASNSVSALASAAFSAGSVLGPLLGSSVDDTLGYRHVKKCVCLGFLTKYFRFDWACFVAATINFVLTIVVSALCASRVLSWDEGQRVQDAQSCKVDETSHLLDHSKKVPIVINDTHV